ncbi:MAG: sigma 54-interacting transcriptional regulator [Nitrospinae bacterium]|nr:sigma 54-interacting transcriptional regulator [Nitrospinota bacterium]
MPGKRQNPPDEKALSGKQALKYAEDLAVLYRSEKEKRRQLEIANEKLKKSAEEIQRLQRQLELENAYLREEVKRELAFDQFIGVSPSRDKVLQQVEMVAGTDASVLILGETGTGKELVARAIHERSRRNRRALVKVNCGAIPHDLFESEFFGHVKGSFTGAVKDRTGRFQLADGGALFLDEVSEIPLELQSKLLRVLQEGQFERVGEDVTRQVDVRIIAASNRDLKELIQSGRFREDLYYRLSVVPIEIPPLRERAEDIELLADHFIEESCGRLGVKNVKPTPGALKKLLQYSWPGNIRELRNVIERAVILSRGGPLDFGMLEPAASAPSPRPGKGEEAASQSEFLSDEELNRRTRENILAALEHSHWKLYGPGGAAELLGIKPTTLAYRMKKFGISKQ